MQRRTRIISSGVATAAALAIILPTATDAGAASSNGIAAKSPQAIITASAAATRSATSFVLSGAAREGSELISFDHLAVSDSGSAHGAISLNGNALHVIEADHVIYISAGSRFWASQSSGTAAAALLSNKWVYDGSANNGQLSSLESLLDAQALSGQFTTDHPVGIGSYARAGTTTVAGQPVVRVVGHKGSTRGALYAATTGKPFIVRITASSKGSAKNRSVATLTFTAYNQPVSATAPPNPVNLATLSQGSGS